MITIKLIFLELSQLSLLDVESKDDDDDSGSETIGTWKKSTEMFGYVWYFENLPKDRELTANRNFVTNFCDITLNWNAFLKYNAQSKATIILVLLHDKQSNLHINPMFTATFRSSRKLIGIYEEKDIRAFVDGDWEVWEFIIKRDQVLDKLINEQSEFQLKIEINVIYNLLIDNLMEKIWDRIQPGPYEDFEAALEENKETSDLVVVAKNGIKFQVHSHLLAARSEVFFSMYKYKIYNQEILSVTSVNEVVVREMLRFFYTGSVREIEKIVYDLLVLVDRYKIHPLKFLCEEALVNQITSKNVKKIVMTIENHELAMLKRKTLEFIGNTLATEFKNSLSPEALDQVVYSIYCTMGSLPPPSFPAFKDPIKNIKKF